MKVIRTVSELRRTLIAPRREGRTIGLVPTMGALHAGHLALLERARGECDVVVMSLFVNPAQFNEAGDLAAYPRDEARDAELARAAGVDLLFAPGVEEVYPDGFATTIRVGELTEHLEGAIRGSSHFEGVATVVGKLLNMAGPDVAYFGQKDAQQVVVLKRMVRDLDIPVQITVVPTVREADGLALSSRNAHLTPPQREQALSLSRALRRAAAAVAGGERDTTVIRSLALAELRAAGLEPDYFELVSPETLTPLRQVEGPVLALVAARVGSTRLIDNHMLTTADPAAGSERQGDNVMPRSTPDLAAPPVRTVA